MSSYDASKNRLNNSEFRPLNNVELKKLIRSEIAQQIKPLQDKIAELYVENLRLKIALGGN